MVKMPTNEAESEDSGPEVNTSESDSDMSDSSESSEMTENELRIGRKIADYNEILGKIYSLVCRRSKLLTIFYSRRFRKTIRDTARGVVQGKDQVSPEMILRNIF